MGQENDRGWIWGAMIYVFVIFGMLFAVLSSILSMLENGINMIRKNL